MGTTPEPLMNIDRRIDPSNPPESQNGDDGDSGDDISRTLLRFDLEKCDSCKDLFMGSCQRTGKNLNDMQECPNHEGRVNEGWNF
jgi:hypothetical protein